VEEAYRRGRSPQQAGSSNRVVIPTVPEAVVNTVQIPLTLTLNDAMVKALADLLTAAVRQALAPPPPTVEETKRQALLIDGKEASRLLGVCEKTLQRMSRTGDMPPLIKIGRAVRWSYPALQAWVEAGCPPIKKD
jgi:predicted DNA-binding transcriptional regulator AlpA